MHIGDSNRLKPTRRLACENNIRIPFKRRQEYSFCCCHRRTTTANALQATRTYFTSLGVCDSRWRSRCSFQSRSSLENRGLPKAFPAFMFSATLHVANHAGWPCTVLRNSAKTRRSSSAAARRHLGRAIAVPLCSPSGLQACRAIRSCECSLAISAISLQVRSTISHTNQYPRMYRDCY